MKSVLFFGEDPTREEDRQGSPFEKLENELLNKVPTPKKSPEKVAFQKERFPNRVTNHNGKNKLRFPAPRNH